jgi:hypothetical protein
MAPGTGLMLISGDRACHAALQGALQAMTGTLVYLGPQPERAAALRFARKGPPSPLRGSALLGLMRPSVSSSRASRERDF